MKALRIAANLSLTNRRRFVACGLFHFGEIFPILPIQRAVVDAG
jgi:hypothetical protein